MEVFKGIFVRVERSEVPMRGRGEYHIARMKQRDARTVELCQHLHSAIDTLEQMLIAHSEPQPNEESERPRLRPFVEPPTIPANKFTFSIKEATLVLGIGRTTIYQAIAEGKLHALKLGSRTLITADSLRSWLSSLPRK
jgi:excisionase family DNA binding protein